MNIDSKTKRRTIVLLRSAERRGATRDRWERTFATVTVEANALIAPLNDRMPAILRREDHARWLGPEEDPRDVLRPYPPELRPGTIVKSR